VGALADWRLDHVSGPLRPNACWRRTQFRYGCWRYPDQVPVPGSGKQTTPQKKIFEGQQFYSVQAAAEILNRAPRTLRRLESQGVIPRPRHELPRSRPGMRWYSEADLAPATAGGVGVGFCRASAGNQR
jgi:hypothetical protein